MIEVVLGDHVCLLLNLEGNTKGDVSAFVRCDGRCILDLYKQDSGYYHDSLRLKNLIKIN